MADPIPAADPALLAAQAKAGQAGVDAYKAAQNELANQRQSAVQQAMQEAALRGAPAGAVPSIQSNITAPYDQGIASLTGASAAYQADMARRDQRMNDYNLATQAARSYIPQQVELAVAPIRARGEFDVRQTQVQGEQRVAEIGADTELQMARMAAAAQAAQIAAAKSAAGAKAKAMKLDQGDLAATLLDRAQGRVAGVAQAAGDIVGKNSQEAWTKAVVTALTNGAKAKPVDDKLVNQSYWDTMAARYTAQGASQYQAPAQPKMPPTSMPRGIPGMGGGSFSIPGAPADYSTPEQDAAESARKRALAQASALQTQVSRLAQQRTQLGAATAYTTGLQNKKMLADYTSYDPNGNRIGYISQAQLGAFNPFDQSILSGAAQYGGLNSGADVRRLLVGEAGPNDRGIASPYAAEALQRAQYQSAADLVEQGYEITDPDVQAAIRSNRGQGVNLFDLTSGQYGQRTNEQQAEQDDADIKEQLAAERQAAQDQRTVDADQARLDKSNYSVTQLQQAQLFQQEYGIAPPAGMGTPDQVWAMVNEPDYINAEIAVIDAKQADPSADIDDILADITVTKPGIRKLLKAIYG